MGRLLTLLMLIMLVSLTLYVVFTAIWECQERETFHHCLMLLGSRPTASLHQP